jgi:hypothetical protein
MLAGILEMNDLESTLIDIESLLSSKLEEDIWKGAAKLSEVVFGGPERIWNTVVKYGSQENEELQRAIALCVLEHILERHFDEYFPKIRQVFLAGNRHFRRTFLMCGKFGQACERSNSCMWDEFAMQTR